jgi:hypothetical protein
VIAALFAGTGLLWAALSVLDPFRPAGSFTGPLLVLLALAFRRRRAYAVALAIAIAYGLAAHVLIEFRGDSPSYYAYLRSAAFDRDLDFRNEWEVFANGEPVPATEGRTLNVFSVGPAVLWTPFYALAHLYVRIDHALGSGLHPIDGFSLPYRRSTALGTVTVVVLGAAALTFTMARTVGLAVAVLSVVGAICASPILYYTFFAPAMSHGMTFGAAAATIWAWERARREPSLRAWVLLGALFGILSMCRWQASVYIFLVLPLAVAGLLQKKIRPNWLAASACACAVAFLPQMVTWRSGFGEWVLLPHGRGFFDLSSPRLLDTLVSANHGFFNWTPLMLVGFLGLLAGLRVSPMLYGGGLAVFFATAWINGSVPAYDWAGGDAFGARRYCLVVPLMALGVGRMIELSKPLFGKLPLLVPAGAVAISIFWNLGFISHFRARKYPEAAPLARLASDQARFLAEAAQDVLGFVFGPRGRAIAYKVLDAEYFYGELNRSGTILVRDADERYLLHGWGTPSRRVASPAFRRALFPEACVRIPLDEPFPLRVSVSARAPDGVENQSLTMVANGNTLSSAPLSSEWTELPFVIPEEALVPGENVVCLRFATALPGEVDGGEGEVAALVERIQLP